MAQNRINERKIRTQKEKKENEKMKKKTKVNNQSIVSITSQDDYKNSCKHLDVNDCTTP